MKKGGRHSFKIFCFLVCAAVIAGMLYFPALSDDAPAPTLFVNDTSYFADAFPLEIINGEEYGPAYILNAIPGGETVIIPLGGVTNVIIRYNSLYLTCIYEKKTAYYGDSSSRQDGMSELKLDIRYINLTYYVPARDVFNLLKIEYERWPIPRALRIYDSSAKLTFLELINKFYPTEPPPTTTQIPVTDPPSSPDSSTDPPTTAPPTKPTKPEETEPSTQPEDTTPRRATLVFIGAHSEYTGKILALLKERELKAVFYLTGADIAATPGAVREYVAAGHEIGIYLPKMADSGLYASYIDSVNILLAASVKFTSSLLLGQDDSVKLAWMQSLQSKLGYQVSSYNIKADEAQTAEKSAEQIFRTFTSRTSTTVCFGQTEQQYESLRQFVKLIDTKSYYSLH